MVNKNKLISELENVIYESNLSKNDADELLYNYIDLINKLNLYNYKINIQSNPIKLIIKHKAFNNKIYVYFIGNCLMVNNNPVELSNINYIKEKLLTNTDK